MTIKHKTENGSFSNVIDKLNGSLYWKDKKGVYLGVNEFAAKLLHLDSPNSAIGKTDFELFTAKVAETFTRDDMEVMRDGKEGCFEEAVELVDGTKFVLLSFKQPLYDEAGKIVGIIGCSFDITNRKKEEELQYQEMCDHLQKIVELFPGSVYWKNKDGLYLGLNTHAAVMVGLSTPSEVIGKTDYDLFSKAEADKFRENDLQVMASKSELISEEAVLSPSGKRLIQLSVKKPMFDKNGDVNGIMATTIDITARKEAARLVIETEHQKTVIAEQKKFATIVEHAVHDIGTPLLTLDSTIESCASKLSEDERLSFIDVKNSIESIFYELGSKYGGKQHKKEHEAREGRQPVLVSLAILDLLIAKRYQYKDRKAKVGFKHEFGPNSAFAFIKAGPSGFERMMSNIINNAVDAFDGKEGEVVVKLVVDEIEVKIIIQDYGKGMPEDVLQKLRNNISVTSGKQNGHGVGMMQVRDAIKNNNGEIKIESEVGKGTKITITFPIIPMPAWIADEIYLHHGDTIVILDDDPSIHSAWDLRFKDYKDIVIKHFTDGEEALAFINDGSDRKNKRNIILLADYELLNQKKNGLEIIKAAGVPHSILVTSHFSEYKIIDLIKKAHIKMLPKKLASEVPIKIIGRTAVTNVTTASKVEVVIIEDNQSMADSLANLIKKCGKETDVYYDGKAFLDNFAKYSKDTKMCIDYSLGDMTGVDVAKKLHEAGYTELFLFTGWDLDSFEDGDIPLYMTMILKTDTDEIKRVLAGK